MISPARRNILCQCTQKHVLQCTLYVSVRRNMCYCVRNVLCHCTQKHLLLCTLCTVSVYAETCATVYVYSVSARRNMCFCVRYVPCQCTLKHVLLFTLCNASVTAETCVSMYALYCNIVCSIIDCGESHNTGCNCLSVLVQLLLYCRNPTHLFF